MLAIIGGTGLSKIDCFEMIGIEEVPTPYSAHDVPVTLCRHETHKLAFLPRHGKDHALPPHKINYRANLWALKQLGVTHIIAVNAVGGINQQLGPGKFAVPDQIIDYSSGRETTFHDGDEEGEQEVKHIDFTFPYDQSLRQNLLSVCLSISSVANHVMDGGVYACMNAPRLETAAEIVRIKRDGCDMVGMTGMPEAALARELDIAYASLALSVNWAAGIGSEPITMEDILGTLDSGMKCIREVLQAIARQHNS